MPCGSLYRHTLELVRQRPVTMTYAKLAEACFEKSDGNVTETWLRQFATGRSHSPDVDRVQAVYEVLTGKPLIADNQ